MFNEQVFLEASKNQLGYGVGKYVIYQVIDGIKVPLNFNSKGSGPSTYNTISRANQVLKQNLCWVIGWAFRDLVLNYDDQKVEEYANEFMRRHFVVEPLIK